MLTTLQKCVDFINITLDVKQEYKPFHHRNHNKNTNNYFSSSATTLSCSNEVEQIDCPKLESLIVSFPVTIQDVARHESQRLQKI